MKKMLLAAIVLFLSQAAFAAPTLTAAYPSSGDVGVTLEVVTLEGESTLFDAKGVKAVSFGPGTQTVLPPNIVVLTETTLEARNLVILPDAVPGPRTVEVTYNDDSLAIGENIFRITSPQWVYQFSDTPAPKEYPALYDIQFIGEKNGFAVGNYDGFYKTTDRGVTWTKYDITGDPNLIWYAVSFVDANTGYAAGTYYDTLTPEVYKTTNGGANWSNAFSAAIYGKSVTLINDIYFADANRGWAVAKGDTAASPTRNFFYTTNGGTSWTTVNVEHLYPAGGGEFPELTGVSAVGDTVWVTGKLAAPAVAFGVKAMGSVVPQYVVYKSTNSGASFSPLAGAATFGDRTLLSKVQFLDANNGYVVADLLPSMAASVRTLPGCVYRSVNGGSSWTDVSPTSPTPGSFSALSFINTATGDVVGAGGAIYRTPDGGSSWTYYYKDPRALYGVTTKNIYNSWVAGGGGIASGPVIITMAIGAPSPSASGRLIMKNVVSPALALTPAEGSQGTLQLVTANGRNLQSGSTADFGSGITVNSVNVVGDSSDTATIGLDISSTAALGPLTAAWSNQDGGKAYTTYSVVTTTTSTTTTTTSSGLRINNVVPGYVALNNPIDLTIYLQALPAGTSIRQVRLTHSTRPDLEIISVAPTVSGLAVMPSTIGPWKYPENVEYIGYWDVEVTDQYGNTASLSKAFLVDLPPGTVFFFPTLVKTPPAGGFKATAAQADIPRTAYTLAENKDVDIYIYDVREAKVIYHRKYAAGQPGGKMGYNEVIWNGVDDFGNRVANGAYYVQVIVDGKFYGKSHFAVGPAR